MAHRVACIIYMCGVLLLTACEAPATPVAAVSPTQQTGTESPASSRTAAEATASSLRYGIEATTYDLLPDSTLAELRTIASVEIWSAGTDPATFDIVAAYGNYTDTGWQQSPVSHQITLLVNHRLAPLDNAAIRDVLQRAIDQGAMTDALSIPGTVTDSTEAVNPALLRTELANRGYPDGFRLTIAYTPSVAPSTLEALRQQLINSNIETVPLAAASSDVRATLTNNRAHLMLASATQSGQIRAWTALEQVTPIALYTLPISYTARNTRNITFTDEGLPRPDTSP